MVISEGVILRHTVLCVGLGLLTGGVEGAKGHGGGRARWGKSPVRRAGRRGASGGMAMVEPTSACNSMRFVAAGPLAAWPRQAAAQKFVERHHDFIHVL